MWFFWKDFAPRFIMSGRYFTPKMFMRTIINEKGIPRIRIRVLPVSDYAKELCSISVGSNHSFRFFYICVIIFRFFSFLIDSIRSLISFSYFQLLKSIFGKYDKIVSYFSTEFNARLTTDVAVDFIAYEKWFLLNDRRYIVFGNDEPFRDKVDAVANEFLNMVFLHPPPIFSHFFLIF